MNIWKASEFKAKLNYLESKAKEAEEIDRYDIATQYRISQLEIAKRNTFRFMTLNQSFYKKLNDIQVHLRQNYFKIRFKHIELSPKNDIFYLGAKAKLSKICKKL